jgi:hypothetical protein
MEGDVQSMDDTRDITENGQANVNEQVGTTSALQEDAQWREDNGKDDLANVAVSREVSMSITPCLQNEGVEPRSCWSRQSGWN